MSKTKYILRAGMVVIGGSVWGLTTYYTYHAVKRNNRLTDAESIRENGSNNTVGGVNCCCTAAIMGGERVQQFSRIANCYDSAIGMDEFFMGINILRRILLQYHASGTVLEVGAGTGRNIPYYKGSKVRRVILVDVSDAMLEQAKQKISQRGALPPQFAVKQGDSASLNFCPSQAFDTVVDTFGLCSYQDPVAVLKEMVRVCKPGGKILLLEHGRSKSWSWITHHLDKYAAEHAKKWGCVWNRDLDELLEAVGDVMEVKILNRWHFGTTYYVVCQPKAQKLT